MGAIPALVKMTVEEADENIRRKALYALSSEMRNYQPATDEAVKALPEKLRTGRPTDAADMEAVDQLIASLRERK